MFKPSLQKMIKDSYYAKHVPAFIQILALGAIPEDTTKPIHEATLDDLAFAAQALDKEQSAIYKRLSAIRELYTEARSKDALGAENIVDALSRKMHPHATGARGGTQDMERTKGGSTQNGIGPWMRMVCRSGLLLQKLQQQIASRQVA